MMNAEKLNPTPPGEGVEEDFSRKARRALRLKRAGVASKDSLVDLMGQGEAAKIAGKSVDSCPYPEGDDRRECWIDGYQDPALSEGIGSVVRTVARADSAAGRGLSAAGHFAARVAQRHPAAAIGAIGGAVLGHRAAQGIDKNLPDGQHLTRGAKTRWAASGAAAGAVAGAGAALVGRIKKKFEGVLVEDSYYVGYHAGGKKEVFRSPTIPNGYSHPKYGHVQGPFASAEDAHHFAVQEDVISIINAEVDRINEGDSAAARSRPRDIFTTYPSAKSALPREHPHLVAAIRSNQGKALSTDVVAQTARGEVPLGHVDDDGFHYLKLGLKPNRIPENEMYGARGESLTFATRPMSFVGRVKEKIQEIESLEEKDKWMQDVHPKKGALHKQLDIPQGKKIATSTLHAAAKKGGLLGKRANLALRYRGESS